MGTSVKPGVLCYVVPPPGPEGETARNRVVEVLRPFPASGAQLGFAWINPVAGMPAWWVFCATPIETIYGTFNEVPIPECWLRPINGDDAGLVETAEAPLPKPMTEPML